MTGILGACSLKPSILGYVQITDQAVSLGGHGTITVTYTISNDGTVKDQIGTVLESWLNGVGGNVANYEARVTVQYGSLTSGTTGSWLSCSTTRGWSLSNSARDNSTITTVFLIEIRLASSGVVQDSATIELDATSYSFGGGG